jgi:hypothetical protein
MSEIAKRGGQPYPQVQQRQFLGNGITRSCNRCGAFVMPSTGSNRKPWGFVCAACGEKGKA